MSEDTTDDVGTSYTQTIRRVISRIFKIMYRPKTVFVEISRNPDYVGPAIIFTVNILLSMTDIYVVYSKIQVEELEGLTSMISSDISSFLIFSLIESLFWESTTLLIYLGCFLLFFFLFKGKGKAKTVLSVIGYSFFVAFIGKCIFTAAGSQLPILVIPSESSASNGVSLMEMWKSLPAASWIFEARTVIRQAMKFLLSGFCAAGMHFSYEISWVKALTAAAFNILIGVLFFGF